MYSNGCMYPELWARGWEGRMWCGVTEATGGPEINQSQRVYCRIYWCVSVDDARVALLRFLRFAGSRVTCRDSAKLLLTVGPASSSSHSLAPRTLSALLPFAPRAIVIIVELIARAINNCLFLSLSFYLSLYLSLSLSLSLSFSLTRFLSMISC